MNGGREKGDRSNLPERPATNLRSVPGFAQIGPVPFSAAEVRQDLWELASLACCGGLGPEDQARLEALLAADEQARRFYGLYMLMHAELMWRFRGSAAGDRDESAISRPESPAPDPQPVILPIIIDTAGPLASTVSSFPFSAGGWLFSYAAATVIMTVAILGAWAYKVSLDSQLATTGNSRRLTAPGEPVPPGPEYVGRITATADCRWSGPHDVPFAAAVPLGGTYAVSSGLMEITYNTGAKVLLEGPCTYEIESPAGGFLSLGKLTARVETKGEGGRGKGKGTDDQKSEIGNQKSPFPLPPSLFVVRTPTAVVTDLGTEFGVEVDGSGATRSYVFRGRIEMRAGGPGGHPSPEQSGGRTVVLDAHQSARVEPGQDHAVRLTGEAAGEPLAFTREMPHPTPVAVFSTGLGLKEGETDPHWQIVARSDDPAFKPRPALVTSVADNCLPNDPARSQWISLFADTGATAYLPEEVTYTFRTTFDLTGVSPGTAVLEGRFLADNHVDAIRLNGRHVDVPVHDCGGNWRDGYHFQQFHAFKATSGFVVGTNVLEIVVFNGDLELRPDRRSPMLCRVELKLSAVPSAAHKPQRRAAGKAGKGDSPMNGP